MAGWPFNSVATAPNMDTTFGAVPTSLTVVDTASPIWLIGATFSNPTAASITILVTDSAGNAIVPTVEVPANFDIEREWAVKPTAGLKWQAGASGLLGQLWGYK